MKSFTLIMKIHYRGNCSFNICNRLSFRQILLIGGSNPIEDVEKFKEQGYVKARVRSL